MFLKFYYIREDYVKFLSQFDSNVKFNKNEARVYLGIILEVENYKYFAPLGSPKPKHKNMKNSLDFIKLDGGNLGVINLNNMIPVLESEIIYFDIENQMDERYKNLLYNQIKEVNKLREKIIKNGNKIYREVKKDPSFLNGRCVNFSLMEVQAATYFRKIEPEIHENSEEFER